MPEFGDLIVLFLAALLLLTAAATAITIKEVLDNGVKNSMRRVHAFVTNTTI